MFDAAKHMQRAECFLGERMRHMVTVRPRVLSIYAHTDTVRGAEARKCSGLLQEEVEYHMSTGYDIVFECWAVADRLSLHAIAADCEWALARLWKTESVYTRAALDLSPSALQRIARSLCAGAEAAQNEFTNVVPYLRNYSYAMGALEKARKFLIKNAPAQTMMEWRKSKEGQA